MLCHRVLRPITDTRTVAEAADINTMIGRAQASTDSAPIPNRRGRLPPILASPPEKSC
jgi:hypothetical protein